MASKPNPLKSYQNSLLQEATIQSTNITYFCILRVFFFIFLKKLFSNSEYKEDTNHGY